MSNQQQGCFWISWGLAIVGRSLLIRCSFLKKHPIITDHGAASQACSIWENHLTGDKLDRIFTAGAICDRSSKKKATSCARYLNKNKDKTRLDSEEAAQQK